MIKTINKHSRLLAFLVFFNLTPGLIFPNLTAREATAIENKAKTDYIAQIPTRFSFFPSMLGPLAPKLGIEEADTAPSQSVNQETDLRIITAYSSTPDQTDSTPFITASGSYVEDGIVAANFLEFNTKIRFPELYGEKVFIVKDRMAKKNSHKIDIWFPTREEANRFGVKKTRIEIIGS